MYLGKVIGLGKTPTGVPAAVYKVSSQTFSNRVIRAFDDRATVVPATGSDSDGFMNPYLSYNCVRTEHNQRFAILSSGSHTDPITDKLDAGMTPRDALALTLMGMDYERDELSTPRIAAILPATGDSGWLATIRYDGVEVKEVPLRVGRMTYLAAYGANNIEPRRAVRVTCDSANELAKWSYLGDGWKEVGRPITAVAVVANGDAFSMAAYDMFSRNIDLREAGRQTEVAS